MKLYHIPGSCALAPHIIVLELGLPVDPVRVFYRQQQTELGEDYQLINPLGYVPTLGLDDGTYLRETPVIMAYLAGLRPDAGLAPPAGSMAHYRLLEWMAFIGTEVHKGYAPLLQMQLAGTYVNVARPKLYARFAYLDRVLAAQPYLMGEAFSIADAYLFTVTRWGRADWMDTAGTDIDLSELRHLGAWFQRVAQRPAVQAAIAFEMNPHG